MFIRVKFCGLTQVEDALLAAQLGVDAIGLIFTSRSRRQVSIDQAQTICRKLPPFVSVVALFMDDEPAYIKKVCERVQPDLLQFHGQESEAWCRQFGYRFLKSLPMGGSQATLQQLLAYPQAAGLVLDGHGLGEPGGSGRCFDWSLIPPDLSQPLILAGGLHAGNVAKAIHIARPWGVDVSSGIESTVPGIKDHTAMKTFIKTVRAME